MDIHSHKLNMFFTSSHRFSYTHTKTFENGIFTAYLPIKEHFPITFCFDYANKQKGKANIIFYRLFSVCVMGLEVMNNW